jgi:hypothetical protein
MEGSMMYMPKSAQSYMPKSATPVESEKQDGVSGALRSLGLGFIPDTGAAAINVPNFVQHGIPGMMGNKEELNTYKQNYRQNPLVDQGVLDKAENRDFTGIGGHLAQDVAGEASLVVPEIKAFQGAGLAAKAGNAAVGGGATGLLAGASQPDATPGSVLTSLGAGAILNPALAGGAKAASGLSKMLARSVIRPITGASPGWAEKEKKAVETLLKETKGLTPGGIDTSIKDKLAKTTDKIKTELEKNKTPTILNGTPKNPGLQDRLSKIYEETVPGYSFRDPESGFAAQQVNNILNKFAENGPNGQRVISSPRDVFEAKQALGSLMGKATGAFTKQQKGQPLTNADAVHLAAYDTLKDWIEYINPGTSALTEMQHRLYQVGAGAYKASHKGSDGVLGNIPIVNTLLNAAGGIVRPATMGAARTMSNASDKAKYLNEALIQTGVRVPGLFNSSQTN